ncbi:MAG: hypothetical protein IPH81_17715 [Candidatus Microthrix sp.]|nr:hypothetical protein [Candidatus Microthrix sp.]
MSKKILSAKEAAAITPAAASSVEVAALQRTVVWLADTYRAMNCSTNRLLGALSALDLALADGNIDDAREWAYNSLDGLPYIDPDRFMRSPQLLFNAVSGAKPCSFPGCPWHSTAHSATGAWCSERHHQALNGELGDERCATCASVTICPWWVPGPSGPHHLCGPCWEKHQPSNAGVLDT